MTKLPPTDDDARFEKAARLYVDMGFSAERTVSQLCRAGFDRILIARRFPDVPASAYPAPETPKVPNRSIAKTRAGQSAQPTTSAAALLPRVIARSKTATRSDSQNGPAVRAAERTNLAPGTTPASGNALPQDTDTADSISFQYVPLIQCSFPHADPGEATTFSRRNGWLELTLSTARPEMGLPYGVPARLLTIYCASEAIRTRSPEIFLGNNVNEFLRRLDVPITRGERGSQRVYANQLMRLLHCAVSIDENITDAHGRTGLHIRQALFAQEARLWWDTDGAGQGSSLVLSDVLYESILERSAPLSTNAIKQLRKSPMDLDVYAWLVHRLFTLSKPSTITWAQLSGQFGHSYAETRNFRQFFLVSLKRVQAAYPEARLKVAEAGLVLLPSKPHVSRAPGVAKTLA
jgi:hypothetical protein